MRSILALAGGAAAVPLVEAPADAAIISSSSLSGTVISWNQTPSVTVSSLPGSGGFKISTRATANGGPEGGGSSGFFGVVIAWEGAGNGKFQRGGSYLNQAYLAPKDFPVNAGAFTAQEAFANVNLGNLSYGGLSNSGNAAFSGSSKYLLFQFTNLSTTNFGWIELTSATTGVTTGEPKSLYSVTLGQWAYDDSGAQILAGQVVPVPEPATATLAMGGALVAGAAGLRRWRKQRAAGLPADGEQA
ncbi:hypothetical protein LBMAG47_31600 [Planctomycetia bacterium]|nr:hypothetical protein LBMAG47_31600 [Planctomycetia bacterium]